jgi:peroxiredoxin
MLRSIFGFLPLLSLFLSPVIALAESPAHGAVTVGSIAPAFELKDQNGAVHKLADYAGKVVVLEWTNPQCPFVKRHYNKGTMKDLAAKYKDQGVVWLAISSTYSLIAKDLKVWADERGLAYPILDDQAGDVGRAYGAKTTPHMFIINKEGKLAYRGAIDNDPYGDESQPKSFIDEALRDILAGKELLVAETTPYGCSVKYDQ